MWMLFDVSVLSNKRLYLLVRHDASYGLTIQLDLSVMWRLPCRQVVLGRVVPMSVRGVVIFRNPFLSLLDESSLQLVTGATYAAGGHAAR
ncbi:hypothetical protein PBRA_007479 [Plasmodiophora brassicae]|uniref:Uncharacterized protein n=1 Tax=Plasmodiophora brassicae TaxID=37360 RepID=A0A0G4IWR8_PLABS|nr:hypothetical protein PBRA_007479 [Plasmodiophora brassicae]